MDRRTLLTRIAAVAGAAVWSGETLAMELAKAVAGRDASPQAAQPTVFPLAHVGALAALSELIIPTTDTPGAIKAGVPEFVADMYAHWMTPSERVSVTDGLAALDAVATKEHGKPFAQCDASQQAALFGTARTAAAGYQSRGYGARIADPGAPFFFKMRDLVTLGYFTSELGITAELAYIPVPGRWEGDVDVKTWNKQIQL
jgi:gluconate 2-dehydrogenase gamma chain